MPDFKVAVHLDAFVCYDIFTTVMFDYDSPSRFVNAVKIPFFKTEMSNFWDDDDVLLEWEITGTGWCVGSYSHFNSMLKVEPMLNEMVTIGTDVFKG